MTFDECFRTCSHSSVGNLSSELVTTQIQIQIHLRVFK